MTSQPLHPDAAPEPPFCETRDFQVWSLLGILTLFCAMAMDYLRSDMWMDEVITFRDYGLMEHWGRIFSTYPVANNHMLFSSILWGWIRLVPPTTEEIVRFPNLLIALGSIVFLHRQGRRFFGNAAGYFLAMIWAFSPVYLSFFWQLRGYGLTMALALGATFGAFHLLAGRVRHGLAMYALAAALLPAVIPTNVLVTFTLWLFMAVVALRRGRLRAELAVLLVTGLASVIGLVLYVPIWHKLVRVAGETSGWANGWLVIGHWCQAWFGHAVLFMLAVYALRRRARQVAGEPAAPEPGAEARALLPVLLACCAATIVVASLVMSPFPRVFLGLLAPLTLCALLGYRESVARSNRQLILLTFFLLANGLVWYQMTDYTMRHRLMRGQMPQNLLQQFYARNNDVSTTTRFLLHNPTVPPETKIFAGFHQFLPVQFAWQRFGGATTATGGIWQIECLDGGAKFALQQPPQSYPYYPQLILGYNLEAARAAYRRTVGYDVRLEPLQSPTLLTIFQVTGIGPAGPSRMPLPFVPIPPDEGAPVSPPPENGAAIQIAYPPGGSP